MRKCAKIENARYMEKTPQNVANWVLWSNLAEIHWQITENLLQYICPPRWQNLVFGYMKPKTGSCRAKRVVAKKISRKESPPPHRLASVGNSPYPPLPLSVPASSNRSDLNPKQKLDDGWPESVEEQGLLLLVLRHYITRQYIKHLF